MAFDGIVTKSVVQELNTIVGYKVDKVFEPDRNTIILGLYGKGMNLSLLSCISSNNCRIHLSNHSQKNPISAPNFCMLLRKHLVGLKIKKIYTIDLERIVFIEFENNENPNKVIYKKLIIELMGKHSNIILADENNIIIDSLRHTSTEENSNRDIYPTSKYIFPASNKYSFLKLADFNDFYSKIESQITDFITTQISSIDDLDIYNYKLDKIISNTFNGISAGFVKSIIAQLKITTISRDALEQIYNKINEILSSTFLKIQLSDDKKDYYLCLSENNENKYILNYSLDAFYFGKENNELFINYRNSILNLILSTLKKYEKRLLNIDNKLQECDNMETYRLYGELITANLYKIPNKNVNNVKLENYYNNNEFIDIPLDEKYSPSYNAKLYFKKYSKLKHAKEIVNLQKEETKSDIYYIESVVYELEACSNLDDVEAVYDEISENILFSDKLKSKNKNNKNNKKNKKAKTLTTNKLASFNPLKYIIDGYTIFVGRNNKENDYLTLKFAHKNDIWFHTKDIHGSHVILKNNLNETLTDEILLEAAKLAAKHSKAKNSSNIPVDYCQVAFVKKPKGSKPGYVTYSNNKTIYVK